jgi:hypothetical protein
MRKSPYFGTFFFSGSQSPPKSGHKGKKGQHKSPKGAKSPKGEKSETRSASKTTKKSASPKGARGKKPITPPATLPPSELSNNTTAKIEDVKVIEPGSEEWVYVDEKLETTVAKILCDQWDVIENNYVENSKYVFRSIRVDREQIIRYLYNIKKDFKEYLRRPDKKKEFVDSFIKVKLSKRPH